MVTPQFKHGDHVFCYVRRVEKFGTVTHVDLHAKRMYRIRLDTGSTVWRSANAVFPVRVAVFGPLS